uniref:Uncharacterized protein n=1 Tax=Aegilops tauschii subsp. strangulata TaxID=200361 RepID=A0A453A906_AEGTS
GGCHVRSCRRTCQPVHLLADEQVPLLHPCTIEGAESGEAVAASPDARWHRRRGGGRAVHNQLRDVGPAQDALRGHVWRVPCAGHLDVPRPPKQRGLRRGDDDWKRFHSLVTRMGRGSKIIIVSRLQRLARFGSVKPIFLSAMSYDELRYLFKTLSFGSEDPAEHPQLVQIADEFAKNFHGTEGSLVATNAYADVLRRNLDVKFWRRILDKGMRMVKRNLAIYGMHPNTLIYHGHPVDITDFALHPLRMTPYSVRFPVREKWPSVTFGDLITNPGIRPKGDFTLVTWESRIPPHRSFPNFVTSCAQDTHEGSPLSGRKRQGVAI